MAHRIVHKLQAKLETNGRMGNSSKSTTESEGLKSQHAIKPRSRVRKMKFYLCLSDNCSNQHSNNSVFERVVAGPKAPAQHQHHLTPFKIHNIVLVESLKRISKADKVVVAFDKTLICTYSQHGYLTFLTQIHPFKKYQLHTT